MEQKSVLTVQISSDVYLQQKLDASNSLEGKDEEGLEGLSLTHRVTLEFLQGIEKNSVVLP